MNETKEEGGITPKQPQKRLDNEEGRNFAIEEILSSERTYLNSLNALYEVFLSIYHSLRNKINIK